jgi:hypothetical protein
VACFVTASLGFAEDSVGEFLALPDFAAGSLDFAAASAIGFASVGLRVAVA